MKKKTGGGQAGGQEKFWGAMAHPAPLRIATDTSLPPRCPYNFFCEITAIANL